MDLLRFIADHDGRTLNEDDLDAWVYPVDEIPIILADDWRVAISKHYAGEGAAHARPGDILAETKGSATDAQVHADPSLSRIRSACPARRNSVRRTGKHHDCAHHHRSRRACRCPGRN